MIRRLTVGIRLMEEGDRISAPDPANLAPVREYLESRLAGLRKESARSFEGPLSDS